MEMSYRRTSKIPLDYCRRALKHIKLSMKVILCYGLLIFKMISAVCEQDYVRETGIITSAYLGLIPSDTVDKQYFRYLLHTYDLAKVYYRLGGGLRQSLKFSDLKHLPIAIPPVEEQIEIRLHLDNVYRNIDDVTQGLTA